MLNLFYGTSVFKVEQIDIIERSDDKVQIVALKPSGEVISLTGVVTDDYAFEITSEIVKRANLNKIVDFEKVIEGVNKNEGKRGANLFR